MVFWYKHPAFIPCDDQVQSDIDIGKQFHIGKISVLSA